MPIAFALTTGMTDQRRVHSHSAVAQFGLALHKRIWLPSLTLDNPRLTWCLTNMPCLMLVKIATRVSTLY